MEKSYQNPDAFLMEKVCLTRMNENIISSCDLGVTRGIIMTAEEVVNLAFEMSTRRIESDKEKNI